MIFSPFFLVFAVATGVAFGLDGLLVFRAKPEIITFNLLLTVVVIAGLFILRHFAKRKNTWETTASVASIMLLAHIAGDTDRSLGFELYLRYPEVDTVLHFLGGLAVGLAAITLWDPQTIDARFLLPAIAVTVVSVAWEGIEILLDAYFGLALWGNLNDTTVDIIAAELGGVAAVNFLYLWLVHIEHMRIRILRPKNGAPYRSGA